MLAKFIHIVGVFAVMVTTGGVSISSHYCGGSFVENSLFGSVESCCDDKREASCCSVGDMKSCAAEESECQHGDQDEDDGCCQTSTNMYVLDQTPIVQNLQLKSFEELDFLNTHYVAVHSGIPTVDKHTAQYLVYVPPHLIFSRQERFEIFRC